jgi:Nuclease-related domain
VTADDWLLAGAGLVAAVAIAGAAALGLVAYRRYRARRDLIERFRAVSEDRLQDVLLPDGSGGWFHVDFLLLTAAGLVVVDLRDLAGLVFGSEQMTEWTVMDRQRRTTFANPLGPLYDRVAVVRQLAGDGVPVEGRVVFTARASFPKGHPPLVTRLDSLGLEVERGDPSTVAALAERHRAAFERIRAAASPSPLRRR